MSRPLLLAHGWGFDSTFWAVMLAHLPDRAAFRIEAGYLGAGPARPVPPPGYLAIGHSAGFGMLLADLPEGCAGLVAINGVTRFAASAEFPVGVPDRITARMRTRLAIDPTATLHQFHERCGVADTVPSGDPDRLGDGLAALLTGDHRARLAMLGLPVLALAATDDPVMMPAHIAACFPHHAIRWSDHGGHLLPSTRPDWCAAMIAALAW